MASTIKIFLSERVKGASIGATIMGAFGAVWLLMGIASTGIATGTALAAVLPFAALFSFLGSAVRRRLPKLNCEESPEKKRMMRTFAVVNVVQWFAIFGTICLLRNLHLEPWIVPAIVLIIGAHFLPLARIFQARQHLVTGVAMMLCAAAAIVMPMAIRDTVECLSAGLILWASSATALYGAFRMAPPPAFTAQTGV